MKTLYALFISKWKVVLKIISGAIIPIVGVAQPVTVRVADFLPPTHVFYTWLWIIGLIV